MTDAHDDTGSDALTHVRDLYGVPLAEFVRARDALVRSLRRGGDRDAATRVAALRRPSPGAWALNQVARHDPATVEEFIATARAMRAATEKALEGDAVALREIAPRERDAVRRLVKAAADQLGEGGRKPSDAIVQRLSVTVRAALADEQLGELLRAGMLTDDLQPSGLGIETLAFDESMVRPSKGTQKPRQASPTSSRRRVAVDHVEADDAIDDDSIDDEGDDEVVDDAAAERAREAVEAARREVEALEREAERLGAVAAALDEGARAAEASAREQRREADRAATVATEADAAAKAARTALHDAESAR